MPNSTLYRREVAVISANASIEEAARLMRDHHVGSVVVVDSIEEGKLSPIGLITDRDIVVEIVAEGIELKKLSVKDIMTANPVTAKHTSSLHDLITRMKEAKVRRLPIVDDRRHLVGFVSFDDLLEKVGSEISSLSQLSQTQQEYERESRPSRAKLLKSLGT